MSLPVRSHSRSNSGMAVLTPGGTAGGGNPEFTWLYLAIRSRQRSTVQRISRLRCGTIIEVTEMPSEPDADCFSPKIAAIRATFSTSPMRCCLSPIVIVLPQQPRSPSTGIPVLTAIGND
jgi:hypothetical protein